MYMLILIVCVNFFSMVYSIEINVDFDIGIFFVIFKYVSEVDC